MIKMQELHLKFSTLSRNAIIKECINAYIIDETDRDSEIHQLKKWINALFKQKNPDWKRKRNLPFDFIEEYMDVPNYFNDLPPIGGDEE